MKFKNKAAIFLIVFIIFICISSNAVFARRPSLREWKPDFNPRKAKYKCIVSNVSHPAIKGVYAGFAIRDELWKRTNGKIYRL